MHTRSLELSSASPEGEALLSLRGLARRYGSTTALDAVDLDVVNGEFLTILGPSGSGKTTLLRLIGGFAEASEGRILFEGEDIAQVPIERRPFNTVFQDYALFPHMTVEQNTGYGLMVVGRPRGEIRGRVARYLDVVGLTGMADRYPGQLSGGQRQRVALARALICSPRLVLLDEPLAALDAGLRRQMQVFLKAVQRRTGVTFLFVTHDQDEAIALSDRICVMSHGRIEQVGTAQELYYRPESRFVATFFGDNNLIDGCRVDAQGKTVDTPFGTLTLNRTSRLADKAATLCIRPESLSQRPGAEAAAGALEVEAQVREVEFAGAFTRLGLCAEGGQILMSKTASHPDAPVPAPGQALRLTVAPEACALIPAEDPDA